MIPLEPGRGSSEILTGARPCGDLRLACVNKRTFSSFELPFPLPLHLTWQRNYYSARFYAVLLDSRKAIPQPNVDSECGGYFTEAERVPIQKVFADRKVFASRAGCDAVGIGYTNFDPAYNFIGVYAGQTLAEARAVLARIRKLRRFPKANIRLMRVAYSYGD
jgi:hypothetical protein